MWLLQLLESDAGSQQYLRRSSLWQWLTDFICLLLPQTQELHSRCSKDPRSASEFSEICNDKVLFVTKYKVVFSILTIIGYDSLVPMITTEN